MDVSLCLGTDVETNITNIQQDDDERGMVVSVFLDPDNKECSTQFLLDYLQDGAFGPFYGG